MNKNYYYCKDIKIYNKLAKADIMPFAQKIDEDGKTIWIYEYNPIMKPYVVQDMINYIGEQKELFTTGNIRENLEIMRTLANASK